MATIKDIAKQTGFSITTVSRALNDYPDVNADTKRIIKEVADRLDYTPNLLAQSLVTKKSRTIGLLIAGLTSESIKDNFMFQILLGINGYVTSEGYEMILLSTDTSKQQNKTLHQVVAERNLDGVIMEGLRMNDAYVLEALDSEFPTVFIDIPIENQTSGYVTVDQKSSVISAVKYLYRLGHRNIAFLAGQQDAFVSNERLDAYQTALKELDIYNERYIYYGNFAEQASYVNSLSFLLNNTEVTAILSASDVMALGVLKACKELNIEVPDELSIIGFDNILLTEYVTPPLTTISQSPFELGKNAAKLLLDMIQKRPLKDHHIILDTQLIVRDSTKKHEN